MIVVAIVGILSSVAIPQFLGFRGRARQSEVKVNLRSWYMSETVLYTEKGHFAEEIVEHGYAPTDGNRYAYLFSASCAYEVRTTPLVVPSNANCVSVDLRRFPTSPIAHAAAAFSPTFTGAGPDPGTPGFAGPCPNCNIGAMATANLDNELTGIDTWYISTKMGTAAACGASNTVVAIGMPFQIKNDVECN